MSFLIGTSYFNGGSCDSFAARFMPVWAASIARQAATQKPKKVIITGVGDSCKPAVHQPLHDICEVLWVPSEENLGHVENLLGKREPKSDHQYCGWSTDILTLALLAYRENADLVFCEQDCLLFGDCIGRMYRDIGNRGMVFGSFIENGRHRMECAQSLFLVRHWCLPRFVHDYISLGDDRDVSRLPENKFAKMEKTWPNLYGRHSIPGDRARPIRLDVLPCSYQQITPEELEWLKQKGAV
jgi:hypothetical protein